MDVNISAYYHQEITISKLLQIFPVVLLTIGCLGLYGLISFVVNRKLKELAVRKVFGATILHIMGLVSRDYLKLILLRFCNSSTGFHLLSGAVAEYFCLSHRDKLVDCCIAG
jgi:hypothetical protein